MAEYDQQSVSSEDTSLIFDEERVRKLFQACDINDDGYIDGNDLLTVCNELNLEYSLAELLKELGADENGRISYEEFLRRRQALKPEIEALQSSDEPHNSQEYLFTSSSTSLEGAFGGREKWEFDSGARDLSPEPNTLQRLVEAAGGSVTTSNAASLLNLANKLHLAALASLRGDINALNCKLKAVTEERDELLFKMTKNQNYTSESTIEQYEERITELHSVIAELSKKVERQSSLVIEEEVLSEADTNAENLSDAEFPIKVPESTDSVKDAPVNEDNLVRQELSAIQVSKHKLEDQLVSSEEELKAAKSVITSFRQKLREILNHTSVDLEKECEQLNLHPLSNSGIFSDMDEMEMDMVSQKIKRLEADNTVLQISLQESKEYCERLTLLLGKYESNMTTLKLALNAADQALDAHVKLDEYFANLNPLAYQSQEELWLRGQLTDFYNEKERICDTIVEFESYFDTAPTHPNMSSQPPNIDLETAVLVQEVMHEREIRGEFKGRLLMIQRERDNLKLALNSMERKQQELLATINLYEQQNKGMDSYKYQEAEYILRQELSKSLERQSKLTSQLKNANTALLQSLEKHKTKSQAKLHRVETQMLDMVEHHAAQVRTLKQRIYHLEEALRKCQKNCSHLDTSL